MPRLQITIRRSQPTALRRALEATVRELERVQTINLSGPNTVALIDPQVLTAARKALAPSTKGD